MYISERTLYNHLTNIYSKLNASNLIEAYNKAMELGYINPVM
ncbi:LuxR C-terminal-related transcriptional regulator [Fundicoccus sp. Sow4_H7]